MGTTEIAQQTSIHAASTPPPHPITALFPTMSDAELERLADDIRRNGLRSPIVLHDGMILDGRSRLRACGLVGVEPRFDVWVGDGDPAPWVIAANLRRAHYTYSQRALLAARARHSFARIAAERRVSAVGPGRFHRTAEGVAAELLGVSKRTMQRALRLLRSGDESLVRAVESGAMTLAGAEIALVAKRSMPTGVRLDPAVLVPVHRGLAEARSALRWLVIACEERGHAHVPRVMARIDRAANTIEFAAAAVANAMAASSDASR